MKAKKNPVFSIITLVLYAAAILTYIILLSVEYSNGRKNAEKTYSLITQAVTSVLHNAEPDSYAFVEEANNSQILHNFIDNPTNLAGLQMSVGDQLIFSSPAEASKFPSTKSSLVKFFTTSLTSEKGTVVRLKVAVYLLKPSSIYNYGRLTFLIILILTLASGLALILSNAGDDSDSSKDYPVNEDLDLPDFKSSAEANSEKADISANYENTINDAGTIIDNELNKELENIDSKESTEAEQKEELVVDYKDNRPSREELFSGQDIIDVTSMFDDPLADVEEYVPPVNSGEAKVTFTDETPAEKKTEEVKKQENSIEDTIQIDDINFADIKIEDYKGEKNTSENPAAEDDDRTVVADADAEVQNKADTSDNSEAAYETAAEGSEVSAVNSENNAASSGNDDALSEINAEAGDNNGVAFDNNADAEEAVEDTEIDVPVIETTAETSESNAASPENTADVSESNEVLSSSEAAALQDEASVIEMPSFIDADNKPVITEQKTEEIRESAEAEQETTVVESLKPENVPTNFSSEEEMMKVLEDTLLTSVKMEKDISILSIKIPEIETNAGLKEKICSILLNACGSKEIIFDAGKDGCTIILKGANIDQALKKSEKLYAVCLKGISEINSEAKLYIGISARTSRIIAGSRLYNEAKQAAEHALQGKDSPIVAFRVNPEKLKNYVSSESSKLQ